MLGESGPGRQYRRGLCSGTPVKCGGRQRAHTCGMGLEFFQRSIQYVEKYKQSHQQVSEFLSEVTNAGADQNTPHILTVSDVATQLTKKDWNRFVTARISSWAAAYFDTGQAEECQKLFCYISLIQIFFYELNMKSGCIVKN